MLYDILKNFAGSQDGTKTEQFNEGTQAELSDYLAEIVVREGWAKPVKPVVEIENKAVVSTGRGRNKVIIKEQNNGN